MKKTIRAFDNYLNARGLEFTATIIGGAALIILDIVDRQTKDVDCLDPKIPRSVLEASMEFAKSNPKFQLQKNWLNNGPETLKRDLPKGWQENLQPAFQGKAIQFFCLGRMDLIRSKLFAYCDRQSDLNDCIALKISLEELEICFPWIVKRDINPNWPDHVGLSLKELAQRLGYEFKP